METRKYQPRRDVSVLLEIDVRAVVSQFQSVLLVVVAAAVALLEPIPGDLLSPFVVPFVAFLVFSSLRAVGPDDAASVPYRLTSLGVLISYLLVPAVAVGTGALLLPASAFAGVVVITTGPTTAGSALVWARLSDSDVLLTAGITFLTLLLAPVLTPIFVTQLLDASVSLSPIPILTDLSLVVGGGLLASRLVPEGTIAEATMDRLSLLVVGALVYVGVATSAVTATAPTTLGLVVVVTLLACLTVLALTVVVGRVVGLDRRGVRALFFGAGLKNLGVAIAVGAAVPVDGLVVAVVTYYVVQQLVAGTIVALAS